MRLLGQITMLYTSIIKMSPKISDKEISQKLRGSFTLKIDLDNCYDNPDIRVVF